MKRLQKVGMKNWMDSEPSRQLKLVGHGANPFDDRERAFILADEPFVNPPEELQVGWLELHQY